MARRPLSAILLPAVSLLLVPVVASPGRAGEPIYGSAGPPVVEGYPGGVESYPGGAVEEFVPGGYETVTAIPAGEQLYPYNAPEPWLHGYFQEIPAYGGHARFHPYNYKDVLSQSQVAGGWGMSPRTPYSQQFWHRYQKRATMQARRSSSGVSGSSTDYVNRPYPATRDTRRTRFAESRGLQPSRSATGRTRSANKPSATQQGGITPTQHRSLGPASRSARPGRRSSFRSRR